MSYLNAASATTYSTSVEEESNGIVESETGKSPLKFILELTLKLLLYINKDPSEVFGSDPNSSPAIQFEYSSIESGYVKPLNQSWISV